ncbi:hypothetical protein F9C07_2868 [Aspergillus flavus]|uniref:Uncharacterized protein n=1 Tax=Aspergillus flavus (strain ATCC 200026 / FGSC A1120 / IAM 13836 / NRRL 3357 / JCM 12722 / SRRC 167) TaxID=332952 RepID=A0A7U2QRL1_ASPFN|nr:hypothetical protein F9C07_2868 [Aspergillus flavus]
MQCNSSTSPALSAASPNKGNTVLPTWARTGCTRSGIAQLPAICQLSRISALKIQKHWTLFSCPECDLEACRAYVVPLWAKRYHSSLGSNCCSSHPIPSTSISIRKFECSRDPVRRHILEKSRHQACLLISGGYAIEAFAECGVPICNLELNIGSSTILVAAVRLHIPHRDELSVNMWSGMRPEHAMLLHIVSGRLLDPGRNTQMY